MNEEFLKDLAAKKPIPGGGGVAALLGALTNALGSMVCNYTIGKKKFLEYDEENTEFLNKFNENILKFEEYIKKDAEVFYPLSQAYSLPKDFNEDGKNKQDILNPLLKNAAIVPLEVMELCKDTLDMLAKLLHQSSSIVISDVGVAASCARACIESASLNVYINTKCISDEEEKEKLEKRANDVLEKYLDISDRIFEEVKNSLK